VPRHRRSKLGRHLGAIVELAVVGDDDAASWPRSSAWQPGRGEIDDREPPMAERETDRRIGNQWPSPSGPRYAIASVMHATGRRARPPPLPPGARSRQFAHQLGFAVGNVSGANHLASPARQARSTLSISSARARHECAARTNAAPRSPSPAPHRDLPQLRDRPGERGRSLPGTDQPAPAFTNQVGLSRKIADDDRMRMPAFRTA